MELRLQKFDLPDMIDFNYEEIKAEVAERMEYYGNIVYSEDQIKEAKADRASLNKFIAALDDKRKEVKKACMEPYTKFEAKLNEIKSLVSEPVALIDGQIKAYEAEVKAKKKEEICEYCEASGCSFLLDKIWDEKWLNTTCSMSSIKDQIDAAIKKYEGDMKIIEGLTEYGLEARLEYDKTFDLAKALARVEELKMLKAQAEVKEAEIKEPEKKEEPVPADIPAEATVVEEVPRQWVGFKAYLSATDARKLKAFFTDNGIRFEKI